MSLYGTVELGGTKTLVAVGSNPQDLSDPVRIPTTEPSITLEAVLDHLSAYQVDAVGVASFGPLELRHGHRDYGSMTNTPKPGWAGCPVYRILDAELDAPVAIDTDVNGAALGEGRWGAARGLDQYVYVTVGTGIGAGSIAWGRPIGGLGHTETGHVVVETHPDDSYEGRCPYHGSCLEGMASGPALEDRFGKVEDWSDPEGVLELVVFYLAQGLRSIVYVVAPQRIVVGGGVAHMPGFHAALRKALGESLGGYPGLQEYADADYIVAPGLGDSSGLAGGLVLAKQIET